MHFFFKPIDTLFVVPKNGPTTSGGLRPMRNPILPLFLAAVFCVPAARADENDQQFALSLDLTGSGAFSSASGGPGFAGGLGASAFGDWRPLPYVSLGAGFDFAEYPGSNWQTGSWNLGGRLFPLPADKRGEWYLQGTAGLELVTASLKDFWPGNFHGTAGAGYRLFMGKGNALDLGVEYDFFSPLHKPLQALALKAGWTWLFGEVPTYPSDPGPAENPAETAPAGGSPTQPALKGQLSQ